MGVHREDLDGHGGYGARRLPDGTLTATWSIATTRFDAHVGACSCGWLGGEHPPEEDGYEAAVEEWDAEHARPLLAVTVPAEVADAVRAAEQAVAALAGERPQAARAGVGRRRPVGGPAATPPRRPRATGRRGSSGGAAPPATRPAAGHRAVAAAVAWSHVLEGWHAPQPSS